MTSDTRTSQFEVRGRVQGVGFRAATRRMAESLHLRGWVSNQPDASVLVTAAGAADAMDDLEAWLQHGPLLARVDSVVRREFEASDLPVGFVIGR